MPPENHECEMVRQSQQQHFVDQDKSTASRNRTKTMASDWSRAAGVDLGGIPLSRAPQIFRRNTRFAGTVIRPDYQFLPRFGDLVLGLASLHWPTCLQIKQIRITLMTMFKVNTSPPNEVR